MGGWTPVTEKSPSGWTPVAEKAATQTTPEESPDVPARDSITQVRSGAYQTRKGGPILESGENPFRTAALASESALGVTKPPTGPMDMLGQSAKALGNFGLSVLKDPLNLGKGIDDFATGIQGGAKDIGHGLGYRKGDMLTPSGPSDPNSVAAGIGSVFGMKGQAKLGEAIFGGDEVLQGKVGDAQKIINKHLAIDQGKVRVVNEMVRKPLAMLDNKINTEIGQSVNSVLQADEADMMGKGNQVGFVDTTKAAKQARDAMGQTMKGLTEGSESQIIRAESRPMIPLREAKSFKTDVGTAAAALRRAGRYREAAAMDALYDGLNTATQERASELGGQHGKLWQHYIAETRNYKTMQGGLLGELVDEPNHASALEKLIDPKRATESAEISQALKKYGVDPSTFNKAKELGVDLSKYSKEAQMNFFGKMKAIINHPFTAGPAAAGAAAVGHAAGIPGLGFVLPIIVAGRVAGVLDKMSMNRLLKQIEAKSGPEAGRVNPPLEGPMAKPSVTPPNGGGPAPTAPVSPSRGGSQWKGGINEKGVEASTKKASTADQIRALQQQNYDMKDRMQQAGGTKLFTDEEVQQAEKRMQENADLIKELQAKAKRKPSVNTGPVSF